MKIAWMMKHRDPHAPMIGRVTLLLFMLFFLGATFLLAQNNSDFEQISWDDDEEEEVADEEGPGKFDEVLIRLNGEEIELTEEISVSKNDTLDIAVRHLAPGSFVALHMKKGGIKLKRKGFYANSLGQLDLEVRTGGKKLSGQAVIYYTPSNGRKKERQVTLRIE